MPKGKPNNTICPAKLEISNAQKDDLIWQKLEEDRKEWNEFVCTTEAHREVGSFLQRFKDVKPEVMHTVVKGGYNVGYRLEFEDGTSLIMRVPIKGINSLA